MTSMRIFNGVLLGCMSSMKSLMFVIIEFIGYSIAEVKWLRMMGWVHSNATKKALAVRFNDFQIGNGKHCPETYPYSHFYIYLYTGWRTFSLNKYNYPKGRKGIQDGLPLFDRHSAEYTHWMIDSIPSQTTTQQRWVAGNSSVENGKKISRGWFSFSSVCNYRTESSSSCYAFPYWNFFP